MNKYLLCKGALEAIAGAGIVGFGIFATKLGIEGIAENVKHDPEGKVEAAHVWNIVFGSVDAMAGMTIASNGLADLVVGFITKS